MNDQTNKTTFCKGCGFQYHNSLNQCPSCGEKNRKPIKLKWYWVVGIVFIAMLALGAIGNMIPENSQDSTASVEESDASAPAVEDATLDTSAASDSASESEFVPTQNILDYAAQMSENAYNLSYAFTDLSTTCSTYTGTEDWYNQIYADINEINKLCSEAYNINAPAELNNVHKAYLLGIATYQDAMNLLEQGLNNGDTDAINQATIKISEAMQYIQQSSDMLTTYCEDHQIATDNY